MIRFFAVLSLLASAPSWLPAAASAEEAPGAGQPAALSRAAFEELFKWGDYDSLIHVLEPLVATEPPVGAKGPTRADSTGRGRVNLYLGVAYWASGRQEQGVQAFTRAARLDTSLRLDPLYSTPEMEARFAAVLEAERNPAPAPGGSGGIAPGALAPAKPRDYGWVWWTGAVVVAGAAGGTWWYLQRQEKPDDVVITIDPD